MAHFAKLNENNEVVEVNVVNNEDIQNLEFPESEPLGVQFLNNFYSDSSVWKQTSYNGSFRKNYAGIGHTYDPSRNAFIPPKVFNSWVIHEGTCLWEAPIPYPLDGKKYYWDEPTLSWIEITE